MTTIQRFKNSLHHHDVDEKTMSGIFQEFENISDKSKKERKAAFFIHAIDYLDAILSEDLCHSIRDACACSTGGWRLKAMQKIARESQDKTLAEKLAAIQKVTYMGNPVLTSDDTVMAGIGNEGGFPCPCPVFDGVVVDQAVSKTYCYCCAGHFRFHYQIALGVKLRTKAVVSSALNSQQKEPCRFVYEILAD